MLAKIFFRFLSGRHFYSLLENSLQVLSSHFVRYATSISLSLIEILGLLNRPFMTYLPAMSTSSEPHPFVLSIKPTYVDRILSGEKTVELRRRFPVFSQTGRAALIYSTSPVQTIVAMVRVATVLRLSLPRLWRLYGREAAVSRAEFDRYFAGVDSGSALLLRDVCLLRNPLHLTELAVQFEFSPPQSYCYWKSSMEELVTHGRVKATAGYKHSDRPRGLQAAIA